METLILSISEDTCQSTPCLGGALAIQDQEECERSLSDLGWSCKNIMTWPSQDLDFVIKNNDFLIILCHKLSWASHQYTRLSSAVSIKFTLTQADAGREWTGERLTWSKVTTEPADQAITGPGPGTVLCSLRSCSTTVIPIYKMSWAGILSCRLDTSGTSWSRSFSILASKYFGFLCENQTMARTPLQKK